MNEGFIVLEHSQIEQINARDRKISDTVPYVEIYPTSKENFNILRQLYPDKEMLTVQFQITPDVCVDMTSYESVRYTYHALAKQGLVPKDDDDFVYLITKKMTPNKKMIIMQKEMGSRAFENSNVYQYRLKCIRCYDINSLVNIREYNN